MPINDDLLTGYARELKERDKYPLKPSTRWRDRESEQEIPVATPFLVIPNYQGDQGTERPADGAQANYSASIEIVDINTNTAVTMPVLGHSYTLRCRVLNRGAVGCYAGIAEFYVATPAALDALAKGTGPRPAPLGYSGVIIPPSGQAIVTCQHQWTVTDLNIGILVCIYDPIVDKPQYPYDSDTDRHVARRDIVPDFSGTYIGVEKYSFNFGDIKEWGVKIVIQQVNNLATISVYTKNPSEPNFRDKPDSTGTGIPIVTGSSFEYDDPRIKDPPTFKYHFFTFSLINQNLLHYKKLYQTQKLIDAHRRTYGEGTADLSRI